MINGADFQTFKRTLEIYFILLDELMLYANNMFVGTGRDLDTLN